MWVLWILAYVVGLSNHGFYPNFPHVAGRPQRGLPTSRSRRPSLWFVAAVAFVPVIFWNAVMWLQTEDDPDTELLRLCARRTAPGSTAAVRGDGIPSADAWPAVPD